MAYVVHSIDSEVFAFLDGQPSVRSMLVEVIDEPGIDDVAIRLLGQKSAPFQLKSNVSVQDFDAGRTKMEAYAALKEAGPYQLVWEGVDFDDFDVQVVVLEVVQTSLKASPKMVGNVTDGHTAWLVATWTLLFVPKPE